MKLRSRRRIEISQKQGSIFKNIKGWFSSTVDSDAVLSWRRNGGIIADNWKDAQLLFSEDANDEDTSWLFGKVDFLWGYIAVFHTSYISECIKKADMHAVPLAPFLLLPSDYPYVKSTDDPPLDDDANDVVDDGNDGVPLACSRDVIGDSTGGVHGCTEVAWGTSDSEVHNGTSEDRGSRTTKNVPCSSCDQYNQFCNGVEETEPGVTIDVSELVHIRDFLPQTCAPIADFVPWQNGCEVVRVN